MDNTEKILSPEEVAKYLKKSLSWVYKNRDLLGGKKVGGTIFFPCKDEIYNRIFPTEKRNVYQHKVSQEKNSKSFNNNLADPNRHGLLD